MATRYILRFFRDDVEEFRDAGETHKAADEALQAACNEDGSFRVQLIDTTAATDDQVVVEWWCERRVKRGPVVSRNLTRVVRAVGYVKR